MARGDSGTNDSEIVSKFRNPDVTADGQERALVAFAGLETLWVNTGTLCNIECENCYIESSPHNDRLVYIKAEEAMPHIRDAAAIGGREVGFTGGEPFMNPDILTMAEGAMNEGLSVLILTNAMQPMMRPKLRDGLHHLIYRYRSQLKIRVSLDHFTAAGHDAERGAGAFDKALEGLSWLSRAGARLSVAGRAAMSETEATARDGYRALFVAHDLSIDADDPSELVLFPEMAPDNDPPEITEACWGILNKDPASVMCANSRMLIKRKGAPTARLLACTLIPYSDEFDLGESLQEASKPVRLNHPFCASFCVLGGSSCSG